MWSQSGTAGTYPPNMLLKVRLKRGSMSRSEWGLDQFRQDACNNRTDCTRCSYIGGRDLVVNVELLYAVTRSYRMKEG